MKLIDHMLHPFRIAVRWTKSPLQRRRALHDVLESARYPLEPEHDDHLMAFWAVLARTGLRDRHGELLDAGRRFVQRTERDAERRARWTHMRLRLDALEGSLDAHEHFERTTGHRVEPEPILSSAERPLERRRPTRFKRQQTRTSIPGRASVALVAAWLLLFLGTNAINPDPFAFEPVGHSGYAWEQVGERTRSLADDAAAEETVSYAAALEHAKSARHTWLGLFPFYDTGSLLEARAMMVTAIEQADGGYAVPEQAYRTLDIIDGLIARSER